MRIRLSTDLGEAFSKVLEVPDGTTVRDLCLREFLNPNFEGFLIRVIRREVEPTYRLSDGDSVMIIPRGLPGVYLAEGSDESGQSLEDVTDLEAIELAEQAGEWISWDELKAELDL